MPTLARTATIKATMDDPAALYELISVLKDHVIEHVGFFVDRSCIAEIGSDEGDDAAQSWVLDCLAAAAVDFPFLAEVSWDAEREWRAARRRLRLDGVKIFGRKGNASGGGNERKCKGEGCSKQRQHRCEGYCIECFKSFNNIYKEDGDDGQQSDDGGDVASSPSRREDGSDGDDGQKKDDHDHDDDGTDKSGGLGQCMRGGCTKYRHHGCGLYCRNCFELHRGQDTPKTTLKPAEEAKAAVTARRNKRKRQSWDENLADFIAWKEEHDHPYVPDKGGSLGRWVSDQRISYKAFQDGRKIRGGVVMTEERAAKLREAGFAFEGRRGRPFSDMSEEPPIADVLEEGESEA